MERIDLSRADDPRDVIHRAVACLAQGGVVGVPTETGTATAASALQPGAVARIPALGPESPLCLAIRGPDEIGDWVADVPSIAMRLARRVWPGPAALTLRPGEGRGLAAALGEEVRARVVTDGWLTLRVAGHAAFDDILRLVPGPLVLADHDGEPDGVDMLLVDRASPLDGAKPTEIAFDGDAWRVAREGAIGRDDLTRLAGTILLFICTGNTCRSPMAEAICKARLAKRLGVAIEDLPARGFTVLSAGVSAGDGMPAAAFAVEAVRARGGSLKGHQSRRVTERMVDEADVIVAMTADHRDALLSHIPEAEPRVVLLHRDGHDIDDPIGADRETYRRTADAIESHVDHLLRGLDLG